MKTISAGDFLKQQFKKDKIQDDKFKEVGKKLFQDLEYGINEILKKKATIDDSEIFDGIEPEESDSEIFDEQWRTEG